MGLLTNFELLYLKIALQYFHTLSLYNLLSPATIKAGPVIDELLIGGQFRDTKENLRR